MIWYENGWKQPNFGHRNCKVSVASMFWGEQEAHAVSWKNVM